MKKYVYLWAMLLLNLNMMAQIDFNDKNWDTLFIEDFSVIRSWSNSKWQDGNTDTTSFWRCFSDESWPDGVTTDQVRHRQAYQPDNAKFCNDGTMKLIGKFKSQDPLQCGEGYKHAPWAGTGHYCASIGEQHPSVHYHSGTIETINPVGFGYYEIESKMPIHDGANTSFWFWSNIGGTYNEIDVFEHCTVHCKDTMERKILSGIWYNSNGTNLKPYYDSVNQVYVEGATRYISSSFNVSALHPLTEYHRFGCLWLPDYVAFYCDGQKTNEFTESNHIPQHSMHLKITHKEDKDAWVIKDNDTGWGEWNDTVTINYVKAYRLKTDCNTDVVIRNDSDFSNYNYSIKRSITMGAITGVLFISNNNFTMRAVNSIIIDKNFEVPIGTSMTLITQECPYCSDD